jgi:hypothetical protein
MLVSKAMHIVQKAHGVATIGKGRRDELGQRFGIVGRDARMGEGRAPGMGMGRQGNGAVG